MHTKNETSSQGSQIITQRHSGNAWKKTTWNCLTHVVCHSHCQCCSNSFKEGKKGTKGLDWKVNLDRLEAMWVLNMTGMGLYFFRDSQKTYHSQMDLDKIGSVMKHCLDRGVALTTSS